MTARTRSACGGNGGDLSGTSPLAVIAGSTSLFIVRRLDPTTLF